MCTHEDQCVYGNFNVYRTPQCLYTAGVLKRNKRLRECLDDFLLSKSRKNRLGHFSESSPDISRPDWKGECLGTSSCLLVQTKVCFVSLSVRYPEIKGSPLGFDRRFAFCDDQTASNTDFHTDHRDPSLPEDKDTLTLKCIHNRHHRIDTQLIIAMVIAVFALRTISRQYSSSVLPTRRLPIMLALTVTRLTFSVAVSPTLTGLPKGPMHTAIVTLIMAHALFTVTESGSVSPGPGGPSKDKLSVKTLSCAWRKHEEICCGTFRSRVMRLSWIDG